MVREELLARGRGLVHAPKWEEATNCHVYNSAAVPRGRGDFPSNVLGAAGSVQPTTHVLAKNPPQHCEREPNCIGQGEGLATISIHNREHGYVYPHKVVCVCVCVCVCAVFTNKPDAHEEDDGGEG